MWRGSKQSSNVARKGWTGLGRLLHTHPRLVTLCLSGMMLKFFVFPFTLEKPPYSASSSQHDPFTTVKSDFLPETDFDKVLHACKNSHPWISRMHDPNVYPETTQGWVVKFNREGLAKFQQDDRFDGLGLVMNKVLEKESNAFVVRLVVGDSMVDGNLMVARHRDENVAMRSSLRFTPHDVSVLYLATPRDMLGGELVLWPGSTAKREVRKKPAVIWPVKNVLVKFRGDSDHKVRGFKSILGEKRISLVVEQYRIPKRSYHLTVKYCVNEDC